MEYNHKEIEPRVRQSWKDAGVYHVSEDSSKPKYYVLDMFPYPSGAGLHVGHPLGYISSDIFARFKRMQGFNVLHPMGFDAYGLPAEQYAIQTGQHPEKTTRDNIARYCEQLDNIGMCFDWDRSIRTCDPEYYKWTQWAFIEMFNSWYDKGAERARSIKELEEHLVANGTAGLNAAQTRELNITAAQWAEMNEKERADVLMNYRLAYLGHSMVNWCPKLGTVLANDEVTEGVSVRGGYPVEQKEMWQWFLRVSAYSQRLLDGLDKIEWSDSIKETQRNWIGRSEGAEMHFKVDGRDDIDLEIFTTRADTVFGVTFMVLAPESKYVDLLTTADQRAAVDEYLESIRHRTERERMIDRKVTGVFSGSYAINPLSGKKVPVWISDYVLSGYGTGAIMAVPAHDSRDWAFAKHFDLPIIPLIEGADVSESSFDAKEGKMINSCGPNLDLNGLDVKDAIAKAKQYIESAGIGRVKVNYRLRDAIFSRQRYWGEPIPICYRDGIATPYANLPLELPEIDKYLPTENGEPPLGRAKNWNTPEGWPLELNTMPGFAGSSAYYLRYMDPHNNEALVSEEANKYWRQVDLYVGGSEHATGHLIYSRFWNKFLYDLGKVVEDEPFRKLINQGMIQGRSSFAYRINGTNTFVSYGLKEQYDAAPIRVDIKLVTNDVLDTEGFRQWRPEFADAEFITEADGKYICGSAVEKMSKSMFNVVNPDDIVDRYGADTLRLYEMFLGPIEQSKPWDTHGIDGVYRFLKKLWGLYWRGDECLVDDSEPSADNLKSLHKLIKKVTSDIEAFSFNTSIAAFMICINELSTQKCRSRKVLSQVLLLLAPFAPHITQELWSTALKETSFIIDAEWPVFEEKYLVESTVTMAVSFNGKPRFNITASADADAATLQEQALADPAAAKWLEGKTIRKVIVVPGKIVNIVVG